MHIHRFAPLYPPFWSPHPCMPVPVSTCILVCLSRVCTVRSKHVPVHVVSSLRLFHYSCVSLPPPFSPDSGTRWEARPYQQSIVIRAILLVNNVLACPQYRAGAKPRGNASPDRDGAATTPLPTPDEVAVRIQQILHSGTRHARSSARARACWAPALSQM